MKLLNGTDVDVVGQQKIDNIDYAITRLPNVMFSNGAIVRFVLLRFHEFQDYVDQVHKESEDLTDLSKPDIVKFANEEVNDNVDMAGGKIFENDKPSPSPVQGEGESSI